MLVVMSGEAIASSNANGGQDREDRAGQGLLAAGQAGPDRTQEQGVPGQVRSFLPDQLGTAAATGTVGWGVIVGHASDKFSTHERSKQKSSELQLQSSPGSKGRRRARAAQGPSSWVARAPITVSTHHFCAPPGPALARTSFQNNGERVRCRKEGGAQLFMYSWQCSECITHKQHGSVQQCSAMQCSAV